MGGALVGFAIVATLIGVGVGVGMLSFRLSLRIQRGCAPLVYFLLNPCLMFVLVAQVDVRSLLGLYTPIALLSASTTAACFALFALLARRPGVEIASGAMASCYANAGNIGVPIALYITGSTAPVVSVLLAQLLILAPAFLCLFGILNRRRTLPGEGSDRRRARTLLVTLVRSILNPVTIGALSGGVTAWLDYTPPALLWEPIRMMGEAAIPLMLILFGIALRQERPFAVRDRTVDTSVATACKIVVMPLVAWVVAGPVFGLSGAALVGVVSMAALPTAQNVYLFSRENGMPVTVTKDVSFATSVLALPATIIVLALLG